METNSRIYYEKKLLQEQKTKQLGRNNIIIGTALIVVSLIMIPLFNTIIVYGLLLGIAFIPFGTYQYYKANKSIQETQKILSQMLDKQIINNMQK